MIRRFASRATWLAWLVALTVMPVACSPRATAGTPAADSPLAPLTLPPIEAVGLDGRPLRVVATTSIIGDVVGRVGGDTIEQTTLMGPGQDPHSYQPAAADLTAVANADVIFINGWNLEQGLVSALEAIGENAVIVPVSAGIVPLAFGQQPPTKPDSPTRVTPDPHTWLDVANVMRWTENIATTLAALDPQNGPVYQENAAEYQAELSALDASLREQLAAVPEARRVLVTNHDAFAYFAAAYSFDILGTIVPGASTLAEPTASDLSALIAVMQEKDVCAVFTESTVSEQLGRTVAAELKNCDSVQVQQLYSGALGPVGSGADSYIGMMQANVAEIVSGLK